MEVNKDNIDISTAILSLFDTYKDVYVPLSDEMQAILKGEKSINIIIDGDGSA